MKGQQEQNVGGVERWASLIGGGALALLGLARRSPGGLAAAALGGALVHRGATGHCYAYSALDINTASTGPGVHGRGIEVEKAVTVNRPLEEVYRFWRNFENLPRFMEHLESVTVTDGNRSHWVAKAPAGLKAAWDAEIVEEQENGLIRWRSLEGASVSNEGAVWFRAAPGGRGTEVHVSLRYAPPAGGVGAAVAKLFGEEPSQQVESDLRRFRQLMEAGEVPTIDGQPSGRGIERMAKGRKNPVGIYEMPKAA